MRKIILLFTFLSLAYVGVGQTTIWSENFSTGTQYSVTLGGEGSDGASDYFFRTDGPNISISYTGATGYFFAGQDIDDSGWTGSASPSELTWTGINISGYTSLQFDGKFASAATNKIDNNDYIHVQYKIDAGSWTDLIWFENNGTQYNTYFLEDTDFNGDGEGTQLSSTFTNFNKTINSTGNSLDLRITVALDAGGEDFAIEDFTISGISGGNTPPSISNITQNPASGITSSTTVSVSADVTDADGTISGVELHWGTASGSLTNTINMSTTKATYTTDSPISAQAGGTTVYYVVEATDNGSATTTSAEQSYTVLKAEPTNHVTGFTATANSSSQITTSWTDATGATLPDGYLVKAATGGNPTAPVDGTAESDSPLVKNITQGTQQAVFTGLTAETTYNFMIWPYTNSGSDIDYKTDGTIPSASATTEATPALVINEILADPDATNGDANGDGTASTTQDEFVEIYNNSDNYINISGYSIYDGYGVRHVFPKGTYIQPNDFIVVFSGGAPAGFDNLDVQTASTGSLGLNNDGDNVIIKDASNVEVVSISYGSEGGDNQSLVRDPIAIGNFVKHSSATGASGLFFSPSKNINGSYVKTPTVWSGAAKSNSWTTEGNWSNGTPDGNYRAVIPASLGSYPTIYSAAIVNSIVMENGATLLGQENLTVNGTATVKKAFTGYTTITDDDGWYAVSSPVNGMTIAGSDFVPGANDDLYEYDEAQNLWLNYDGGTFDDASFAQAKGYLVAYENDVTNGFAAGDFNKTNAISATIAETNTRWNLIGNPYPSKVTWSAVTITDISSPKVLNATTGAWEDLGTELEVGQGIFVYAEDAGGTPAVSFDLADQTHGAGGKTTITYANLNAIYGEHAVTVRFATNDKTTQNYEWEHDARYLYPISQIPYFSAVSADDVMVSTYVMSEQPETTTVPLYLAVSEEQDINFTFEGEFAYNVVLEDKTNGSMTELSAGDSYRFTALPSDNDDRFVLHLNKSTIGIGENSALEGVKVYANAQNIYIHSDVELTNGIVTVFNTLGQVVLSQDVAKGFETIRMERKGAYIVKVEASEGNITEKVIIQ